MKSSRWSSCLSALLVSAMMPLGAAAQDMIDDDPPEGTPLSAHELEGTGRTMEAGKHQISLAGRYRYGATEWFQVGTTGYEWAAGPNVHMGFTAFADDKHALAVELEGLTDYRFGTKAGTATALYSLGPAVGSRLNLGLGFSWQDVQSEVEITWKEKDAVVPEPDPIDISARFVGIPLHLGYDLALNDVQMVRFWFNPYVYYTIDSETDLDKPIFPFNSGIAYYRGYEQFRIGAGATLNNLGLGLLRELEALALDAERDIPAVPDVLPMPFIRLYWML